MIKKNQASTISCILKQILRCNLDYKGCYLNECHRHCLLIFLFEGSIFKLCFCMNMLLFDASFSRNENVRMKHWKGIYSNAPFVVFIMTHLSIMKVHLYRDCSDGFSTCSLIGEKDLQLRGHGRLVMHGNPFDSSRYLPYAAYLARQLAILKF